MARFPKTGKLLQKLCHCILFQSPHNSYVALENNFLKWSLPGLQRGYPTEFCYEENFTPSEKVD